LEKEEIEDDADDDVQDAETDDDVIDQIIIIFHFQINLRMI